MRPDVLSDLVEAGVVGAQHEAHIRASARHVGKPPEFVAVELGLTDETAVVDALAKASGCRVWRRHEVDLETRPRHSLSKTFLMDHLALPIEDFADQVVVAIADPFDEEGITGLRFAFSKPLILRIAAASDIRAALAEEARQVTGTTAPAARDLTTLSDAAALSPAAIALQDLLTTAVDQRASDIHLEMLERHARVRLRVDGVLRTSSELALTLASSIISRVKVLSDLNVAESRLPQDGRVSVPVRGASVDIRIAITPSIHGESVTLRLLNRTGALHTVNDLSLSARDRDFLVRVFSRRQGLFLVSGPTGSGKTTTLYAGLQLLRLRGLKVISIEDPVEIQLEHVTQIQVAPAIGLGFSEALRSILRHDPDVIMVGEIRDLETAKIAIQAALTGHLVVASVHARDAIRAAARLLDMGVPSYQIGAALTGCIAQRLLRRTCEACAQTSQPSAAQLSLVRQHGFAPPDPLWRVGAGCEGCDGIGYKGRVVVSESLEISDTIAGAISSAKALEVIAGISASEGYKPLLFDALEKAAIGVTTLDEALSLLGDA